MRNPERKHYDTAQTLMVLRGFLIGGLMALLAEPLAAFLDEPRIVPVIYVLTLWPILQGVRKRGADRFPARLPVRQNLSLTS